MSGYSEDRASDDAAGKPYWEPVAPAYRTARDDYPNHGFVTHQAMLAEIDALRAEIRRVRRLIPIEACSCPFGPLGAADDCPLHREVRADRTWTDPATGRVVRARRLST